MWPPLNISLGPHFHFSEQELAPLAKTIMSFRSVKDKYIGPNHGKIYKRAHVHYEHNIFVVGILKEHCTEDQWKELETTVAEILDIQTAIAHEKDKKMKKERVLLYAESCQEFTGTIHCTSDRAVAKLNFEGRTEEAMELFETCKAINLDSPHFLRKLLDAMRGSESPVSKIRPEDHDSPDTASLGVSSLDKNSSTPISIPSKQGKVSQQVKGEAPQHVKREAAKAPQNVKGKAGKASNTSSSTDDEPLTPVTFRNSLMGHMAQEAGNNLKEMAQDVGNNLEETFEEDLEGDMDGDVDQLFDI